MARQTDWSARKPFRRTRNNDANVRVGGDTGGGGRQHAIATVTALLESRYRRLLRQGLHYPGERAWTKAHRDWLASQKLEYAEHRIAFEEMLLAMRQAQERIERLEQAIRMAVPDWSLAEVVTA